MRSHSIREASSGTFPISTEGGNRWGEPCLLYGGDFGERPHDGNMSGNGIFYADHTESPKVQEVKGCYAPVTFSFTDAAVST